MSLSCGKLQQNILRLVAQLFLASEASEATKPLKL